MTPSTVHGHASLPGWRQQRRSAGRSREWSSTCLLILIPGDLPWVSRRICQIERCGQWKKRFTFWTGTRKAWLYRYLGSACPGVEFSLWLGSRDRPHAPCCLWPGDSGRPPVSGTGRLISPLWHHVASLPARRFAVLYRLSSSCIEHLLYAGTGQHCCCLPRGLGIPFLPKVSHRRNSDECI